MIEILRNTLMVILIKMEGSGHLAFVLFGFPTAQRLFPESLFDFSLVYQPVLVKYLWTR